MRTSLPRRAVPAAAASSLVLMVATTSAYAAPPANDGITNARVISTIPSRFVVDTRQATTDPATDTAGAPCIGGRSVWFRYQPTETVTAHAITLGSDFDTLLGVFTGSPGSLHAVVCSDDSPVGAAVRVRFVAGRTYYIAVSGCCDSEGAGGHAVLSLYRPRALIVSAPVRSARAGGVSGSLLLAGTMRCPNPTWVDLSMTISQRRGDRVARGFAEITTICTATTQHWSAAVDSGSTMAFRPGRAAITMTRNLNDGMRSRTVVTTRIVTVRNAPNASPGRVR